MARMSLKRALRVWPPHPGQLLGHHEFGLGGIDRRLFDRHLHSIRLGIEFDQHVAFFHPVVILDQNARHLARDARGDKSDVAIHVGVVRGYGIQRVQNFGDSQDERDHHQQDDNREQPPSPFPWLANRRFRRFNLCRVLRCLRLRFFGSHNWVLFYEVEIGQVPNQS